VSPSGDDYTLEATSQQSFINASLFLHHVNSVDNHLLQALCCIHPAIRKVDSKAYLFLRTQEVCSSPLHFSAWGSDPTRATIGVKRTTQPFIC